MSELRVIADEIHFDGHLVALLTTGVPETAKAELLEYLETGADGADVAEALADAFKQASAAARGGLLRLADLATIFDRIKEGSS